MTAVEELRARVRRDLLKAKAFGIDCGGVLCSDVMALLDALEAALSERDALQAQISKVTSPEYLAEALEKVGAVDAEWQARVTALEKALADARFAIETTVACLNTWNGGRGGPADTDGILARIDALLSAKGGETP